ncbi:MAG: acyl-CoA thioesterase [Anaeroplasma sp.]
MFIYERRAYYHETDQMGVIHHSNYLKWMEEARINFLDSIGLCYKKMEEIGIISPVCSVSIDYKKPVKFDDIVTISIFVKTYTGIKFEIEYEIRNKNTNELCVKAYSKHCFLKDNNVISLKREYPDFHQKFQAYLND